MKHAPDRTNCCARRILSLQPDFAAHKCALAEEIEKRGHHCLFLPKCHPELNYIEQYWCACKEYTNQHCDGSLDGLRQALPEALNSGECDLVRDLCPVSHVSHYAIYVISVALTQIRKYARKSWRFIDAYKSGLTAKQAFIAVKKYKSHRRVPISALNEGAIRDESVLRQQLKVSWVA